MPERLPCLREKSQFLLQGQLGRLAIVNKFDAFNDFIMVFFDQALGPKVTLVIEGRIRYCPNILDKILP